MRISGARAVIECLVEEGVDTVFGYPGGMILPLYNALYDAPMIKHILTVHEQGAAHAADGYARASGRVGVCIATSGPGATNLVTGLAAAYMDSVPVVAITGQVPIGVIGQDAFQEIDIVGMTMAITKHNFQVKDVTKLPELIRYAFRIARSGRPGPVLIDIPRDIQMTEFEFEPVISPVVNEWQPSAQVTKLISDAAEAIAEAKRPVVIVGGGVINANANQELREFAEKGGFPVVSTLMGLGAFPASHPSFLGLTGMHGHKAANAVLYNTDTMIAIGCRFSDRATGDRLRFGAQKTVIHIDIDPAEFDKNILCHIGVAGEMKKILTLLTTCIEKAKIDKWWNTIRAWQIEFATKYETQHLTVPWVMHNISEQTAGKEVIFATDVGQHQMWAAQHLKIEAPRTWLTSGGLGAMGFGLPAAMGAQLAVPDKRVIHIAGDGGMKMTGNELYTIAANDLPVISIVVDNSSLGLIRQLQHAFFNKRYSSCFLPHEIDFEMYAKSFGVTGIAVETPAEFAKAFADALASNKPAVIVVKITVPEFVTPMVTPGAALIDYVKL